MKEFLEVQKKEKGEATTNTYRSKIYAFYKFVSFQDNIKKEEFKKAFERKIKELRLRDSDTQEPIGREMAKKILEECDKLIDGIDVEKLLRKRSIFKLYFIPNNKIGFALWTEK